MSLSLPSFYGLVRQSGPWTETKYDGLLGQKPYKYTPNDSITQPYIVKVSNGSPFETYSSKSLIYDATLTPVIVKGGKARRGKVVKAKKVAIIDSDGKIVNPTDNYFLNKYAGEIRDNNFRALNQNYGSVSDLAGEGIEVPQSTINDESMSQVTGSSSNIAESTIGSSNGPGFDGLNVAGDEDLEGELEDAPMPAEPEEEPSPVYAEPVVDRGAQIENPDIDLDVDFDRPIATANAHRDRWDNPEQQAWLDVQDDDAYLNQGEQLPRYASTESMDVDPPPAYSGTRRRRSTVSVDNRHVRPRN